MENVKLNPGWEKLYHLNFPSKIPTAAPDVSSVVSEVVQSAAASPSPASSSGGNKGKLGKTVLIAGIIVLLLFVVNKIHKNSQTENNK